LSWQTSAWLLFLKYLDGLEQDKASGAALEGRKYDFILDKQYRWESWAAPKGSLHRFCQADRIPGSAGGNGAGRDPDGLQR
jgi:hypothetical protein